jgi:DNA polymerase elongation subunit (family B)
MPSILEELLMARKSTRKLIPQQTDDFMKNVLDKRQLGYKVTANSLYGQCGAKTSTFYEKDIAACTTATGRLLLTYAKKIIEECYGDSIYNTKDHGPVLTKAEYIYGDSVANYTPIYVKKNDKINIIPIEKLAELYGNGIWIICREPGKEEKEFCHLFDVETWTEKGWTKIHRVIRHILAPHKKMKRVITNSGLVDVTDDHSLLLKNAKEISPKNVTIGMELLHFEIFNNENKDMIRTCIENYLKKNNLDKISQIHKAYEHLQTKMNNSTIINNNIISEYVYQSDSITDVFEIQYNGYVYDLTTDNHHFAAGIGSMIVHNTDSVFFTFNLQTPEGKPIRGKEALEITIELAQEAGHLASSFLKGPHDLEYEKTFMPFCLLSKKRYVGMLYETDPNKCKRKEMGIVLKRRDNAPIVKDIYGGIIDILMKEQNINLAIDFLRNSLQNIVDEKYPIDKLIISKSLRSGYKNPQTIAHKVLADRITARDPGNKPSSGDRIPFVYINTNNKKALQCDKIETPNFVKENKLKIDYSFYITNQIMKPVQQVFALVLEKIWEIQGKKLTKLSKYKKEVETLKKKYNNPEDYEKLQGKIDDLRNKEVKTLLFDSYLRETNNEKQGNKSITSFFIKV